jgi:hypothetical protein
MMKAQCKHVKTRKMILNLFTVSFNSFGYVFNEIFCLDYEPLRLQINENNKINSNNILLKNPKNESIWKLIGKFGLMTVTFFIINFFLNIRR